MRWPPCVSHNGAHQSVWGQCVHHGAPCVLRPGRCAEDGCREPVMNRLDLSSGRISVIEEGSDDRHAHPAPLRVEIDERGLAEAIVTAARSSRQERRQ